MEPPRPKSPAVQVKAAAWRQPKPSILGAPKAAAANLAAAAKRRTSLGRRSSLGAPTETGFVQLKKILEQQLLATTRYRDAAGGDPSLRDSKRDAEEGKRREEEKRLRALHDVLVELLTTECNYLADLRFTVSTFAQPLTALLSHQSHYDVFANLQQARRHRACTSAQANWQHSTPAFMHLRVFFCVAICVRLGRRCACLTRFVLARACAL